MPRRNKPRLVAPERIRGKIGSHQPAVLRAARQEWVAEKRALLDGRGRRLYAIADIAEALGISYSSVHQLIGRAGLDEPLSQQPRTTAGLLGLRMSEPGGLWALFEGLPVEVRDGLIDQAVKRRVSIAAAAFEIAAATMQKEGLK